jgi:D-aminoacyl-tRNA deacylase
VQRHRLGPQQPVRDPQPHVERLVAEHFGRHGDSPLGVREPPPALRERANVGVHDIDCGHSGRVRAVRALVQRVSEARVTVGGDEVAAIGPGLLVLLGVRRGDGPDEADRIARKLLALRVFEDGDGKMNLNLADAGGEVLCVSQFTLYGDTQKGNRPSFVDAAPPDEAEPLYERVRKALGAQGGAFGARMRVSLVNDGPVTLTVEI